MCALGVYRRFWSPKGQFLEGRLIPFVPDTRKPPAVAGSNGYRNIRSRPSAISLASSLGDSASPALRDLFARPRNRCSS